MAVALTLKVFKNNQLIATKDFDRDIIKIGRLTSAHLCIDDEKVSRIHSVLDVTPDGNLFITDMGSKEGTYVNGKRVMKGAVAFGDEIRIGDTIIKVEKPAGEVVSPQPAPVVAVIAAPAPAGQVAVQAVSVQGVAVQGVAVQAVAVQAVAPVIAQAPMPPAAPQILPPQAPPEAVEVLDEGTGAPIRARPRRRKGSGPLGLELRFLWGNQMVGEFFLHPNKDHAFTVGTAPSVQFAMGDSLFGAPSFEVVRFNKNSATLRFTSKMEGELHKKWGEQVVALADTRKMGIAKPDGNVFELTLGSDDFAWVDLGGIRLEVFYQPAPKPVFVPFSESVDFTVLNIFLVMFFLAALFVISAFNLQAEGDEFADELSGNTARIAKLLIKPPEPQKKSDAQKTEKSEASQKRAGNEGQMGKQNAPKTSLRAAAKGDPNNKDQARLLVAKVFGQGGGISTIFGHQGLGGELKSAMGQMFGAAAGDSGGLGGLGLRGSGSGGGGVGDTIGIGGLGTRGRSGGTGYGSGVGTIGGKKDVDVGITSSDPTVMGSLDKELIRKVIHANRGQIRYCYESQLNRFPKLEGKVAVKFVISAGGAVATSQVAQSTVNNAELEACVAGRVRTWMFPKPKGGGVVVVTYPFIFKQSGQ